MHDYFWNWMIVVYLFLGGLGAGCLALSSAALLSRRCELRGVVRAGALLAPLLVGAGSFLLVFDLGSPLKVWRLFTYFNPVSPMSVGSWMLTFFMLVSSVYAVLHLPPRWIERLETRLGRRSAWLQRLALWNAPVDAGAVTPPRVERIRRGLAIAGIPLGIGVGIYTGVLLGAIPARPFWNTPMVAQLFLFSAMSTAAALLLLASPLFWKPQRGESQEQGRAALMRADIIFIFFELFLIIPFVVHGELSVRSARESLRLIMGGPYTGVFWGGVVLAGIVVPLLLEVVEVTSLRRRVPRWIAGPVTYITPVLILVGGYLLRWVFVHAGQDSQFL